MMASRRRRAHSNVVRPPCIAQAATCLAETDKDSSESCKVESGRRSCEVPGRNAHSGNEPVSSKPIYSISLKPKSFYCNERPSRVERVFQELAQVSSLIGPNTEALRSGACSRRRKTNWMRISAGAKLDRERSSRT